MMFIKSDACLKLNGAVSCTNRLLKGLFKPSYTSSRTFVVSKPLRQKFSFLNHEESILKSTNSIHPKSPARTRFAPSPTGFLHLGSLRTALYNYLLAKSTGGSFILRLEDTDRTRIVEGAEDDIYKTLEWCNLTVDEGPLKGGPYGPYRQLERKDIYREYAEILIEKGYAYKCYCSKERLNDLRESAMKLKPPTTVTYDRHCLGMADPQNNVHPVIRFKSPEKYDPVCDLTPGKWAVQHQINYPERRVDALFSMKSAGYPT